ncbi:MAG TPA: methylmalonyl Co-A mutase-associated GTPase MeaB [Gemmatimonadales bacterium]|nr:methylmalonyl Co-A mutase-associated GTPase MeaB [Gemmatimonadales bacterium]
MTTGTRRELTLDELVAGVRGRDPAVLGRAVSLLESVVPADRVRAGQLLERLLPHTGGAVRIGISGVPGVGKSTFIETLGTRLTATGHRVAVLAVDPSSRISGGSILGDKTRMTRLATDQNAFIRPSPTAGTLGGVAPRTPETILLCEAAGFDVVLVETVGVGQSETAAADMTDVFLVLMLPGGGDELQGIKRGLLERADVVAVNQADGPQLERAERTARDYALGLSLMRGGESAGAPPVLTCSGLEGRGVDEVWTALQERRARADLDGGLAERRRAQRLVWMWSQVEQRVRAALEADASREAQVREVSESVAAGRLPPSVGADRLMATLGLGSAPA